MVRSGQADPLLAQIASTSRDALSLLDQMEELLMQHTTLLEQRIRILADVRDTLRAAYESAPGSSR